MSFRPLCPVCKSVTILAQITPSHLGFHIRTFECQLCSDIHQIVTEWDDPMQSRKTAGWLRDELEGTSEFKNHDPH